MMSVASELPNYLSTQIINEAQENLGSEYFSIQLEHQTLPSQFSTCSDMQYVVKNKIGLGKQYIKFIGCETSRQIGITVTAEIKVPVAKTNIEKNVVLNENHISINTMKIRKRMKYFLPIDAVLGRTTKRQIRENKVISENLLKTEYLVDKGNLVDFIVAQQGFVISTEMLARESGLLGQRIRIQHPISKKRLEGIVTGINQVSAIPKPQTYPVVIKNKHH